MRGVSESGSLKSGKEGYFDVIGRYELLDRKWFPHRWLLMGNATPKYTARVATLVNP